MKPQDTHTEEGERCVRDEGAEEGEVTRGGVWEEGEDAFGRPEVEQGCR